MSPGSQPTADDFAAQMHKVDLTLSDPKAKFSDGERAGMLAAKDELEQLRRKAASAVLSEQEAANYERIHAEPEPESEAPADTNEQQEPGE